jgi:hypothetical protein
MGCQCNRHQLMVSCSWHKIKGRPTVPNHGPLDSDMIVNNSNNNNNYYYYYYYVDDDSNHNNNDVVYDNNNNNSLKV